MEMPNQTRQTNPTNPTDQNHAHEKLSALLKKSTMSVHSRVEGGNFLKTIFSGSVTAEEYYLYLWSFAQVYRSLETALKKAKSHPSLRSIYFSELDRYPSLINDLSFWQNSVRAVPEGLRQATAEYSGHLEKLAGTDPILLVAHAYVRYLGDLSGGQMIAKALTKNFPDKAEGFSFYHFEKINFIDQFKENYRAALDQVGEISSDRIPDLCREACLAFELNGKILKELSVLG